MNMHLDREAHMWNQWSRLLWLSMGDRNTLFYHSRAIKIQRKNSIRGIWDDSNQWHENREEIAAILTHYYQDLFSTSNSISISDALAHITQVITQDMNDKFSREFHECEIVETLK